METRFEGCEFRGLRGGYMSYRCSGEIGAEVAQDEWPEPQRCYRLGSGLGIVHLVRRGPLK